MRRWEWTCPYPKVSGVPGLPLGVAIALVPLSVLKWRLSLLNHYLRHIQIALGQGSLDVASTTVRNSEGWTVTPSTKGSAVSRFWQGRKPEKSSGNLKAAMRVNVVHVHAVEYSAV